MVEDPGAIGAEDTSSDVLRRLVTLKFLPEKFAED